MSMSHEKAKLIFESTLRAYAPLAGIDIAFDNVAYTPQTNKSYIHTHLMPADTGSGTLKGSDHTRLIGVFQMTIFTPARAGTGAASAIAAHISDVFKADTLFTKDDAWVQVITPLAVDAGRSKDGYWQMPCWFQYRSDTI